LSFTLLSAGITALASSSVAAGTFAAAVSVVGAGSLAFRFSELLRNDERPLRRTTEVANKISILRLRIY
jgi:hypothetical protein